MAPLPDSLFHSLNESISRREEEGRLWTLQKYSDLADQVDFVSNDYLSFSNSGLLRDETMREIERNPNFMVGAGASRVAYGSADYTLCLEKFLAEFHDAEDALLFHTGFDANCAIFGTLPQLNDVILHDSLIHASIHEGMRKSRASLIKSFDHNDATSLQNLIEEVTRDDPSIADGQRTVFIAIESVYSMDGDLAPVQKILEVVKTRLPHKNAVFVIDEAHSSGLMGPRGSGYLSSLGLQDQFAIRMHSFGKGLNSSGAVVLCNTLVKVTLVNYARNFLFSTGPGFLSLAPVMAGYRILTSDQGEQRRQQLQSRVRFLYQCFHRHPLWELVTQTDILRVPQAANWLNQGFLSPIIPLITRTGLCRSLHSQLRKAGFATVAVHHPVVPRTEERVRMIVHACNAEAEIEGFVRVVMNWVGSHAS